MNPIQVVEHIKNLPVPLGAWVVGGYVRRLISDEPVDTCDIDLWFPNKSAEMRFKDEWCDAKTDENEYQSSYTINGRRWQVLPNKWEHGESVAGILDMFDFRFCQVAACADNVCFIRYAVEDINRNLIVPTDYLLKYVFEQKDIYRFERSLCRLKKYIKQGYTISPEEMVNLLTPFSKLVFGNDTEHLHSELR
jgi:hypothetical protein